MLLSAISGVAQIYYIAPAGNDTNEGSRTYPFATVQHGYAVASSNGGIHSVFLEQGNYCMSNTLTLNNSSILLQGSGPRLSVINDPVLVQSDARLADLTCAATFSNAANACLVNNVKISTTPTGAGSFYGLWYDANDYAHLSSLTEPRDGFDAVSANWVSNHVQQSALPRTGGVVSGALYLEAAISGPSQAVTRAYVDSVVTGNNAFVSKSGDTMTGALTTPGLIVCDDNESATQFNISNHGSALSISCNDEASAIVRFPQGGVIAHAEPDGMNFGAYEQPFHVETPSAADHAVTKGYVDQALFCNYDAIIGVNFSSVKAAIDNGATNIFLPPGEYCEDWTSAFIIERPLRIHGAGMSSTKLTVSTSLDYGVFKLQMPNGFFEMSDLDLTVTNNESMHGFLYITTDYSIRLHSINATCIAPNGGQIWFVFNQESYLDMLSLDLNDINFRMQSAGRVLFYYGYCKQPRITVCKADVFIDKCGSGQFTDGAFLCQSLQNTDAGYIHLAQCNFTVTNHVLDAETFLQINGGSGQLDSLHLSDCSVNLNKANEYATAIILNAGVRHAVISDSRFSATRGIRMYDNTDARCISNVFIEACTFDTAIAVECGTDARAGTVVSVANCAFNGVVTNAGCRTAVLMESDRIRGAIQASVITLVSNMVPHVNQGYYVLFCKSFAANGRYYETADMYNDRPVYTNVAGYHMYSWWGEYWTIAESLDVDCWDAPTYIESSETTPPPGAWYDGTMVYDNYTEYIAESPYIDCCGGRMIHLSQGTNDDDAVTLGQLNAIALTPGPTGPTGPQGLTGAQGPTGPTGVANLAIVSNLFLLKAGDAMSSFLTLHANPQSNMQAATKHYVDNSFKGLDYDALYVYIDKYYDGTNGYEGTLQAPYTNFFHALTQLGSNAFYGHSQPVVYHLGHGFYSYPKYNDPGYPAIYLRIGIVGRGAFYKNIHADLSGDSTTFTEFGTFVDNIHHAWPAGYNTNNAILYLKDVVVSGAYLSSTAHDDVYCDNVVFLSTTNNGQQSYHGLYYTGSLEGWNDTNANIAVVDSSSLRPGYWSVAQASNDASYVRKSGDTMSGTLNVTALLTASNINVSVPDWHVGSEASVGNIIIENSSGKISARRGHLYLESDTNNNIVVQSPLAFSSSAGVRGLGASAGQAITCAACSISAQVIITPTTQPYSPWYVSKSNGWFRVDSQWNNFTFDWLVIPAGP
jgi:hypothetical protein